MNYAIQVNVETVYMAGESNPDGGRYVFAYTITIENTGDIGARLMSRHWLITDADGRRQEVRGEGVVGEQPYLQPGESFQYTSGAILETPVGAMEGSYQMQADDGNRFDAPIPAFSLAVPGLMH
jgi:ApaG protein